MGVGYSPRIVTNGLVFYVNPSDPKCYSGGSTCRDLTRINGDGILSDVSFSIDKAFRMNSAFSRVYFNRSFTNVTNSTTYIVTAEIPSNASFPSLLSSLNNSYGGVIIYASDTAQHFVSAYISENSGDLYDELPYDITANYPQKRVIACTINGSVFKLYINGNLISTRSTHTGGNVNAQSLIELGAVGTAPTNYTAINVKIYNSLIYNRALNDNEILQNHNALKGRLKL
jgi:hypothetical protein